MVNAKSTIQSGPRAHRLYPMAPRPILPIAQLTNHKLELRITIPNSLIVTSGSTGMRQILSSLSMDATQRINSQLSLMADRAERIRQRKLSMQNKENQYQSAAYFRQMPSYKNGASGSSMSVLNSSYSANSTIFPSSILKDDSPNL